VKTRLFIVCLIASILLMYSAWVDQGKMKPCNVANTNVEPASKTSMKRMRGIFKLASYVLFLNLGHQHMQIFIYAHEQHEIETKNWFYQKELIKATRFVKIKFLFSSLPPTQHHSFFRSRNPWNWNSSLWQHTCGKLTYRCTVKLLNLNFTVSLLTSPWHEKYYLCLLP